MGDFIHLGWFQVALLLSVIDGGSDERFVKLHQASYDGRGGLELVDTFPLIRVGSGFLVMV